MPNSVSELIENPKSLINANVPTSETGIVTAGMIVARQSSRNRKITRITIAMASPSVTSTSRIESPTTVVESNAIAYSSPGGKLFDRFLQRGLGLAVHLQRVGVRQLLHADAHAPKCPLYFSARTVVFGAHHRVAHVFQLHQAVRRCSSE